MDVRMRNDGRPESRGRERSRVGDLTAELLEFKGAGMEAVTDERETGRVGGSMDIVRESGLARSELFVLRWDS